MLLFSLLLYSVMKFTGIMHEAIVIAVCRSTFFARNTHKVE